MSSTTCNLSLSSSYYMKNLMLQCYYTLKERDRFTDESGSHSNFETFWDHLNHAFSMISKAYRPNNSTVEAFYRGTLPIDQFLMDIDMNIIQKGRDKLDSNLDPLLTISWDVYRSSPHRIKVCERLSRLCGRQLWAVYNKLDIECSGFVHIDDVTQVIMKICQSNGKEEDPQNIREWFCEQKSVDFWSFFSALVENHSHLLKVHIIQSLYEEIVHEVLMQGKMTKKGHKVQTWKDRWFVLTSTNLSYYESLENRILKGSIVINQNSRIDHLPGMRGRSYLFRVTDGSSGRIYDISAPDPQALQNWTEILTTVVAAHSEKGRHLFHKMSLAKAKLFPSSVTKVIQQPMSPIEYNEGIYRVVSPKKTSIGSSITTSGSSIDESTSPPKSVGLPSNSSSTTSSPTHVASAKPQDNSVPPRSSRPPKPVPYNNQKPKPPLVTPYVQHAFQNHDYAVIDDDDNDEPLNQVDGKNGRGSTPGRDQVMNEAVRKVNMESRRGSAPTDQICEELKQVNMDGRGVAHKGNAAIKHVKKDGYDYALVDKLIEEQQDETANKQTSDFPAPRPKPKPRNAKPKIVDGPEASTYAQLSFSDGSVSTSSEFGGRETQPMSPVARPSAAKTKFDYSQVLLTEVNVTQDLEKAQELKSKKPPPPPPTKYDPNKKSNSRPYNSDSDIIINKPTSPHNPSAPYYQNVNYGPTESATVPEENAPPIPRRLQSNRGSTEPSLTHSSAPVPPPRSLNSLVPPLPPPR